MTYSIMHEMALSAYLDQSRIKVKSVNLNIFNHVSISLHDLGLICNLHTYHEIKVCLYMN